ncbi:MAG TPA: calcium-binding protein [Burkholderiales bacterium]|nr:calcium-binding protein [Burkholderiales bacterium]
MTIIRGGKGDDQLRGGNDADYLYGGRGNDAVSGFAGNDYLYGNAGDDQLSGDLGNDMVFGGAGNDVLTLDPGDDFLYGGNGNDLFVSFGDVPSSDPGHDYLDGGRGIDGIELGFGWTGAGAVIDLSSGTATGGGLDGTGTLTLTGIENVTGSAWADTIIGNGEDNVLRGFEGDDLIYGLGGNDTLSGDGHADTLIGGDGNDRFEIMLDVFNLPMTYDSESIDGGNGIDVIDFRNVLSGVAVDVGAGAASGGAEDGSGTVSFTSIEDIIGSPHSDILIGDPENNVLRGWDGDDQLAGGGGNDILVGDSGGDQLSGGEGADIFAALVGTGTDLISDFQSMLDRLAVYGPDMGAEGNLATEDGRFYAAPGATSGNDTSDRLVYDTSSGNLYADPDGSGATSSTLVFTLQGAPTLAATDITIHDYSTMLG